MRATLKEHGVAADVFVLPDFLVEGTGRPAVRLAAAHAGADAVLIVTGAFAYDNRANGRAWLYAPVVTIAFVKGNAIDALFLAQAGLWDYDS